MDREEFLQQLKLTGVAAATAAVVAVLVIGASDAILARLMPQTPDAALGAAVAAPLPPARLAAFSDGTPAPR